MSLPWEDRRSETFKRANATCAPCISQELNQQPTLRTEQTTPEHSTLNVQPARHPGIRDLRLETRVYLPTGIEALDQLLTGGLPRGGIVEISGPDSSGKTSLGLSILAQSTRRGEIAAYVDVVDSLDPKYAQAVGIDLENLLWIRCTKSSINQLDRLSKALKATDILCQAGGFGVVTIDIVTDRTVSKIPRNTWFRLQRAIRGTSTVLVVISSRKITGSASSLLFSLERNQSFWTSGKRSRFMRKPYFQGIESEASLLRGRSHGSVTVHCRF